MSDSLHKNHLRKKLLDMGCKPNSRSGNINGYWKMPGGGVIAEDLAFQWLKKQGVMIDGDKATQS